MQTGKCSGFCAGNWEMHVQKQVRMEAAAGSAAPHWPPNRVPGRRRPPLAAGLSIPNMSEPIAPTNVTVAELVDQLVLEGTLPEDATVLKVGSG